MLEKIRSSGKGIVRKGIAPISLMRGILSVCFEGMQTSLKIAGQADGKQMKTQKTWPELLSKRRLRIQIMQ